MAGSYKCGDRRRQRRELPRLVASHIFFFNDATRVSCDDGQRVRKVGGGRRRVDFPGEQRQLELRKDILLAAVSR